MATKSGQTGLAGEDTRNYGLDILKILSMVYVVILHALGQGGMMNKGTLGMQFAVLALFYITTPAVNIFALVTGYVSFTEKKKPLNRKRLFEMWFQVVFYALVVTTICRFVVPDAVTTRDFVSSVMPLYYDIYWYFTAYFLVSVLSPFINAAVRTLSESTLRKVFFVMIFFFSFFTSFCYSLNILTSHTFTWIFLLYIMGAIMKKCHIGESLPSSVLVTGIILCNFFNWIITWVGEKYVSGSDWYFTVLSDYISPTMVIQTICYLLLFRKIKASGFAKKLIKFMAPLVFATYGPDGSKAYFKGIEAFEPGFLNPNLTNSVTGHVSARDSVSDPEYVPSASELGKGDVSVGLGHDARREGTSAYVDGYIQADLAAVLQDPVIRSMSREQVEKAAGEARRKMQKAAADLDFTAAARYRDEMWALEEYLKVWKP